MSPGSQDERAGQGIRPLDPFRDTESVVELIHVAFGDRLDPAGRATLERMRRFARGGLLIQWAWAFLGKAIIAPGLVWEAEGRVVGNVSLRRARSDGGYLIGNVVVHPDRRGQGIASALMREAIKLISRRGARWVGLEVRADNDVARRMYEGFGFREVGRTQHLLRPAGLDWAREMESPDVLRRAERGDGGGLVDLMESVIPAEHRPLLEVQASEYRPGWRRRVEHWLRGEDEIWWVSAEDAELQGAVRVVRKRGAFPNQMEVLIRRELTGCIESQLVRQGVRGLKGSPRKAIEIQVLADAATLVAALEEEGFQPLRRLVQMKRTLKHRISVSVG